jgi:catechol-2,3-dioxygenase
VPDSRAPQFDHLAINVPGEEALLALQRRLKTSHCEVTDVIDHGAVRSVYFTDPNGIALEASWWVHDPTGQPADYHDPQQFADPDPVAAVVELQTTGTLTDIQDSRLSHA